MPQAEFSGPPQQPLQAAPEAPMSPAAQHMLDRLRACLMRQSLTHLLDQVPGSRQALPHLAALEATLGEHDTSIFAALPRPVLFKLCRQLSGLPLPPGDAALHDLLDRLLHALESAPLQGHLGDRPVQLSDLSDVGGEHQLLVAEASFAEFAAVSAGFATTQRSGL